MVNPSLLQQLGKEHQREFLEAARIPRTPDAPGPRVRQRIGWSLVWLGLHLAMNPRRQRSFSPLTRS